METSREGLKLVFSFKPLLVAGEYLTTLKPWLVSLSLLGVKVTYRLSRIISIKIVPCFQKIWFFQVIKYCRKVSVAFPQCSYLTSRVFLAEVSEHYGDRCSGFGQYTWIFQNFESHALKTFKIHQWLFPLTLWQINFF